MDINLKELWTQGKTIQVIQQLQQLTANDNKLNNDVLLLLTRLNALETAERRSTINYDLHTTEYNKLTRDIFTFIDELPDNSTDKTIKKPTDTPTINPTQQGFIQHAEKIINIGHIDNANFS